MAKTERMYASTTLDGTDATTALGSFRTAQNKLSNDADRAGRELLWDTLQVEVQDYIVDDRTFADVLARVVSTENVIIVSAMAVKR